MTSATSRPACAAASASWNAEPYADALRTGHGPLFLRRGDGWLLPLEVERWCSGPDEADLTVLARCRGTVLDVGCGPGRLVGELAARGRTVLGIDVSPEAVARTAATGGQALRRSVFEPLPGEGRWGTVLLLDGNLGIGGEPQALLRRLAAVLAPDGVLIAETAPVDVDESAHVRLVRDARPGAPAGTAFPWARLGTPALLRHATRLGWLPAGQWSVGGRCFAALRNRSASRAADPANSAAVTSSQRSAKPSPGSPVAVS